MAARQHPHPLSSAYSASEQQPTKNRMAMMAARARPYSVGVTIYGVQG